MSIEKFQFLESLSERLRSSANVETIYGKPIQAEGKTIIPVGRVAYGLGGGYGKAKGGQDEPVGEGGGGGIKVSPVGVIEIHSDQTRFIPIHKTKTLALIAFFTGFVIGKLMTTKKTRLSARNLLRRWR